MAFVYIVYRYNEIFSEENQLIVGGATRTEFFRQGRLVLH